MVFLIILFCVNLNAAQLAPVAKSGDMTDEPQKYVLSHTDFPEQGLRQFDCSQCSEMKDTIFISPASECGNGGCNFLMFKIHEKSFKYITTVFLHASAFQFLKSSHHGLNDFISYNRSSAFEGEIVTYEFNGHEYKRVGKAKTIKSADFDKHIRPGPVLLSPAIRRNEAKVKLNETF